MKSTAPSENSIPEIEVHGEDETSPRRRRSSSNADADVIIIGGGAAGLACGLTLLRSGFQPLILEAGHGVGGRIRTSRIQDCRVDHGFQILLTGYPELARFLNLEKLELGYFQQGAHVYCDGDWRSFFNPLQRPWSLVRSLRSGVFNRSDFWLLAKLRLEVKRRSLESLWEDTGESTARFLHRYGFSDRAVAQFFRPFLGGVFLEPKLETSAAMFRFVYRMFNSGGAALPFGGIQGITDQMAHNIGLGKILCDAPVTEIDCTTRIVSTAAGHRYHAPHIVVATNNQTAAQLLPDSVALIPSNASRCWTFLVDHEVLPASLDDTLRLVADEKNPIQVIASPSKVAGGYAPLGSETLVVTAKEGQDMNLGFADIQDALKKLFGPKAQKWQLLAEHRIPDSLPSQLPKNLNLRDASLPVKPQVWICGDHCDSRSLNGALRSGRMAAEGIIASADGR